MTARVLCALWLSACLLALLVYGVASIFASPSVALFICVSVSYAPLAMMPFSILITYLVICLVIRIAVWRKGDRILIEFSESSDASTWITTMWVLILYFSINIVLAFASSWAWYVAFDPIPATIIAAISAFLAPILLVAGATCLSILIPESKWNLDEYKLTSR